MPAPSVSRSLNNYLSQVLACILAPQYASPEIVEQERLALAGDREDASYFGFVALELGGQALPPVALYEGLYGAEVRA